MKPRWMLCSLLAAALVAAGVAQQPGNATGGPGMGMNSGMMGQGIAGTVTEVASDHYTVKTLQGDTYTIQFSDNTRILKQAPMSSGGQVQGGQQGGWMHTPPTLIKASDIKVGDTIMARGQVNPSAKSIGAFAIMQLDPALAQHMRTMEESFGKTWLAGRITAIDGKKVTVEGGPKRGTYTFVTDENTKFRDRGQSITLADLQVGAAVRVEGSMKEGQFVAARVHLMMIRAMGGPTPRQGPPPQ